MTAVRLSPVLAHFSAAGTEAATRKWVRRSFRGVSMQYGAAFYTFAVRSSALAQLMHFRLATQNQAREAIRRMKTRLRSRL